MSAATYSRTNIQVLAIGNSGFEANIYEHPTLRHKSIPALSLREFDYNETERYLHHRIDQAGGSLKSIFELDAIQAIFRYSKGILSKANLIADAMLYQAYQEKHNRIDSTIAIHTLKTLEEKKFIAEPQEEKSRRR